MNIITYHINYLLICVKFKLINGKYQINAAQRYGKEKWSAMDAELVLGILDCLVRLWLQLR